jgi:hypothetical protein
MLPDDVLLETFDFYVDEDIDEDFEPSKKQRIAEWIMLAHVCRRWRRVVFQSPLRLNLRLLCTPKTPARAILDVWPPLPLIIHGSYGLFNTRNGTGVENIIAALEHNDRVCQIKLRYFATSELEYVTAAMHKPFPELTHLRLGGFGDGKPETILPHSFLGGSTPRLRSLILSDVPFPGLPKLLSSATHLVNLDLSYIPRSGYIPPEAMATSLCVDQPRVTSPSFSIPTTSPRPRKPASASAPADTLYPPRFHQNSIQRGQRIFGGNLGPDRCPSTQQNGYNLLQSNHIRHTTTLPVHQSSTKADGTGKGLHCI